MNIACVRGGLGAKRVRTTLERTRHGLFAYRGDKEDQVSHMNGVTDVLAQDVQVAVRSKRRPLDVWQASLHRELSSTKVPTSIEDQS